MTLEQNHQQPTDTSATEAAVSTRFPITGPESLVLVDPDLFPIFEEEGTVSQEQVEPEKDDVEEVPVFRDNLEQPSVLLILHPNETRIDIEFFTFNVPEVAYNMDESEELKENTFPIEWIPGVKNIRKAATHYHPNKKGSSYSIDLENEYPLKLSFSKLYRKVLDVVKQNYPDENYDPALFVHNERYLQSPVYDEFGCTTRKGVNQRDVMKIDIGVPYRVWRK